MKILIRATNWVGDAIMALPALRAVRARFPDAEITILARSYVAAIYKNQTVCDNMMFVDSKSDLVNEIRVRKFDLALLFQNAFEAAWLAWRAGIPERIGYARDGRSLLLTKAVPVPKPGEIPAHEQFYYLELLRACRLGGFFAERNLYKAQCSPGKPAKRRGVSSFCGRAPGQVAHRHWCRRIVWFSKMLAAESLCRTSESPSGPGRSRCDSIRHSRGSAGLLGHCVCHAPPADRSHRKNFDRRSTGAAFSVPSFHRKRLRRDARRRSGWSSRRSCLWANRSLRHRAHHPALQHRPGKTILQPVFSAPLPDGSPLHDRALHARRGRSRCTPLDFLDGGASCLKPVPSVRPFFSIATAPSPKKSAT